jgi:hypothetical protein
LFGCMCLSNWCNISTNIISTWTIIGCRELALFVLGKRARGIVSAPNFEPSSRAKSASCTNEQVRLRETRNISAAVAGASASNWQRAMAHKGGKGWGDTRARAHDEYSCRLPALFVSHDDCDHAGKLLDRHRGAPVQPNLRRCIH